MDEFVLFIQRCEPNTVVVKIVIMVCRQIFVMERNRDIYSDELYRVLEMSGSAGIVSL